MYPLPTVPTVEAVPRTQTWESKVLLRPSGQHMCDWIQLKPLYGCMILAGGCGDLLTVQSWKISLLWYKFPCSSKLPPVNLEWLASFFHCSLPFCVQGLVSDFTLWVGGWFPELWLNTCFSLKISNMFDNFHNLNTDLEISMYCV